MLFTADEKGQVLGFSLARVRDGPLEPDIVVALAMSSSEDNKTIVSLSITDEQDAIVGITKGN